MVLLNHSFELLPFRLSSSLRHTEYYIQLEALIQQRHVTVSNKHYINYLFCIHERLLYCVCFVDTTG